MSEDRPGATTAQEVRDALLRGSYASVKAMAVKCLDECRAASSLVSPMFFDDPPAKRLIGEFLYLPVEIAAREMRSKARLAGEMAKRGFQVVIGNCWDMQDGQYADLPPGIVLLKTLNAFDAVNLHYAQMAGHRVACLNEEALGLVYDKWIHETETNAWAREHIDLYCCQGEPHFEVMKQLIPANKLRITGNPRSLDYELIRSKRVSPDKIVICGMAGTINNLVPLNAYLFMAFKAFGGCSDNVYRLMREQIEHEADNLPLVMEMVGNLPGAIFRPHPSEDWNLYNSLENITLDARIPFMERLQDAALVYYVSGCTTGLEADLAGVPAVRIGYGGHGISMEGHIKHMQWADYFSADTLADELESLQEDHSRTMKIDLTKMLRGRQSKAQHMEFCTNKFPEWPTAEVQELAGHPVTQVGWNMWVLQP